MPPIPLLLNSMVCLVQFSMCGNRFVEEPTFRERCITAVALHTILYIVGSPVGKLPLPSKINTSRPTAAPAKKPPPSPSVCPVAVLLVSQGRRLSPNQFKTD